MKLKLIFGFIFILFISKIKANPFVNKIKFLKTDTAKITAYNKISLQYIKDGNDSCLITLNEALLLCNKKNIPAIYKIKTNAIKGNYFIFKQLNDSALLYYAKALSFEKKISDSLQYAKIYLNIGICNNNIGNIDIALIHFFKALSIFSKLNNHKSVSNTLNSIGNVYEKINNNVKAIYYFKKAIQVAEKNKYPNLVAKAQFNLSRSYMSVNKIDSAFLLAKKAYITLDSLKDDLSNMYVIGHLGTLYFKKLDLQKSILYYNKALNIAIKLNDLRMMASNYDGISEVYTYQKNYLKAYTNAINGLVNAEKVNEIELEVALNNRLSEICYKLNNFKSAADYSLKYSLLKDTLYKINTTKALADAEAFYENDKKQIEIVLLNEKQNTISEKLKSEKNKKLAYGLIAVLSIAGVGFVYYRYKQKRKTNLQLTEINNKINRQNNTLKTLNTELIVSEENLYKSNNSKDQLINMMSHDLLNPITAITNYNQQIISRKNNTEQLLEAFKTVDAAIQPMHSLLDNMLQWTAIQKEGIKAKLKIQDINDVVKEIIGIYRPQAQLKFIKINDNLPDIFSMPMDKSILSLILRNLINNAIKYSANETAITVSTSSINKTITIQDEGFGMTDEMIHYLNSKELDKIEAKGSGLGLKLCYEFAEAIGARIHFTKNERDGVKVEIRL